MTDALLDAASRERIRTSLDETLFVDAGAGSGKTTVLVDRVVSLVQSGVPMARIAAVTFTEKAGAELRDRIRVRLECLAVEPSDTAAQAHKALDDLDGAAIGTLHSFAARILTQHPVEAGLPPLIEMLEDVASQVAFERRWDDTQTMLLEEPAAGRLLRLAFACGVTLQHLRTLARVFDSNWDLVEERVVSGVEPTPPPLDLSAIRAHVRALLARLTECSDGGDKLATRIADTGAWAERLDAAVDDTERLGLLIGHPSFAVGNSGQSGNWTCDVQLVRNEVAKLEPLTSEVVQRVTDAVVRGLARLIGVRTLEAAEQRRVQGHLEFHDLLVLARRLVRSGQHGAHARAALQQRYQRLLLDEFQDTDPIQIELAVRIAAGAAGDAADWRAVEVPPGSLFIVGDPKQSIYRFRRADISTFLDARNRIGTLVALTTNFRASDVVLDWVNTVFGRLIVERPGAQPAYRSLNVDPARPPWVKAAGPAVVALGAQQHPVKTPANALREAEARDVAGVILRAVRERWQVDVRDGGAWSRRDIRLEDITVLVPARTSIAHLEAALDDAGIPYRTEATSFVYSAREVRDLLLCARAVDDPTDELALVATLRSPLFGCGDDDLWRWKQAHGRWSVFANFPDTIPEHDPVREAMAAIRAWTEAKPYLAPSELLERVVAERRAREVAVDSPRYRETWRRLRFALDQARAWSEAQHGSLRDYLGWANLQAADTTRVSEVVLPETDSNAVRITTIHAAKGLQWPMVIVSGMASRGSNRHPSALWGSAGGWEVHLSKAARTSGYDGAEKAEDWLEHCEDRRLLYVAATRAQSHLAVSLHRAAHKSPPQSDLALAPAELLAEACRGAPHEEWTLPADEPLEPLAPGATTPLPGLPPLDEWSAQHGKALAAGRIPAAVSATDIAHGRTTVPLPPFIREGLDKKPRALDLPPWAKGRYGTAIGRAVHATLQTVDLATGDDIDDIAAAAAVAEGVVDQTELVAALARSALASEIVQRAANRPHWKETYVGTIVDGVTVEGYVDLMFREDDGSLAIVDYKTDAMPTGNAVNAYDVQLDVYARAVTDATKRQVSSRTLVFCRPDTAQTVPLGLRPG